MRIKYSDHADSTEDTSFSSTKCTHGILMVVDQSMGLVRVCDNCSTTALTSGRRWCAPPTQVWVIRNDWMARQERRTEILQIFI